MKECNINFILIQHKREKSQRNLFFSTRYYILIYKHKYKLAENNFK